MTNLLIDIHDYKSLARPVSVHIDEQTAASYIRESQDMYIVPAVGYDTVKRLTESQELSDGDEILLNGGEYEATTACGCKSNGTRYCYGLKKALAYYAYAKMSRADGGILSRAGYMRHEEQYGRHVSDDVERQYNDIMDVATKYLDTCLDYMKTCRPVRFGRRVTITAIGY